MLRQHIRSKRLQMTPEISCNLSCEQRASDGVYFRVIETCVYQIFCCVSVRPRLTNWKFVRDKFCREFWKGETNFVSPARPDPLPCSRLFVFRCWADGGFENGKKSLQTVFSRLAFFPTRPYLPVSPSSLHGQRHLRSRWLNASPSDP